MKVFAVCFEQEGGYCEPGVDVIFSSRELAQAYIDGRFSSEDYLILEFEVFDELH